MTPFRGLLLGLALLVTALTPALHAQYPPCCSGGMQVHTYHIYFQRQQSMQQQMAMSQQMQMMQLQQQAVHLNMMQMHFNQQARAFHQQQHFLTQQARSFHQNNLQLAMTSRHLSMQSRALYTQPRGLGMMPRALHMEARSLHQQSRTLYTEPRHLHTEARALHQQSRQLHTTARALHMEARQLHTDPRQLSQQSLQLNQQARSLNTKTAWCTQSATITVVSFNVNCGQCHQNSPTPKFTNPVTVQGPRPTLPGPVGVTPLPRMTNVVALPLPRLPNLLAPLPGAPLPNAVPDPRRLLLMQEMWARPNQPWLPNMAPGMQPNLLAPLAPAPGPVAVNEPLWQGAPQRPMLAEPWTNPGKRRPKTKVALLEPADSGTTVKSGKPAAKPKLTEPVRDPALPTKNPTLAEAMLAAEVSRPLPAAVLQAPALPDRALDDGLRRGLTGDADGEPAELVLPIRPLLADADLQAPELPALPLSVLLTPPDDEQPDGADDADRGLPEFTPRAPLPVARADQTGPGRTSSTETPLAAPALPSLPPSVLGPG
jgi:hypothetical protein